jgi:phosphate-selective porin OprO/OprP
VPYENAFCVRGHDGCWAKGWGAWQVGARYSYLDLQDKNIGLGVVHGVTAGLNWFLNPNAKIQWNYIWEYREVDPQSTAGVIQGFGMSFRFDF